MPASPPRLSVIIPAYNEAARLPTTLERVWDFLQAQPWTSEIMVVDDGSQDATGAVTRRFGEGKAVRLLQPGHQGKGGAVREGMLKAEGDALLLCDADLATPIEDVTPLLAALDAGADIAIGSRAVRGSVLHVRQPLYRELMGRAGNLLIQAAVLPGLHDTQCGFKLFHRAVAREVFSRLELTGMSFDIEALTIARRLSYSIVEVPVHWSHQPGSKLRLVRDYGGALRDLVRIRRLHPP